MRLSTASRYKFLKDYKIGIPEVLSETSYTGTIIYNESDLRKSIGWLPTSVIVHTQLGQDIDGEATGDQSGISVSINAAGDRVAVGAINNDGSFNNAGQCRIYQLSGSSWIQLGQDIDGEAASDQSGVSVSMNSAGDRVAIGANLNDGSFNNAGQCRIYQLSGSSWIQLGQDIDGEAASDQSGRNVSINAVGDIVAIGANFNTSMTGQCRVYQYNGSVWIQIGQDIDGVVLGENASRSVSINAAGNIVAIGANLNDGSFYDVGKCRIYQYNGSAWIQVGQDIYGEFPSDNSGFSVSINAAGNIVAIGAYQNPFGTNIGQCRVYQLSGSSWVKIGQNIDGEAAYDQSGFSVSINAAGNIVAIGANLNDGSFNDVGQCRIYQLSGSSWVKVGQDIDGVITSEQSGYSVSINSAGTRVAIGAPFYAGSAGRVKVYNTGNAPYIRNDSVYTAFNDDIIQANRPTWKYSNNLNFNGGWYDIYNNQFVSDILTSTIAAEASSSKFSDLNSFPKGYKWVEIATKKNTNISLSATQLSAIYFKLSGFQPKLTTTPTISWVYNDIIVNNTLIYGNVFNNVAPNFILLSSANVDNIFLNYTPEIQQLSALRGWKVNGIDSYFTQNALLSDFNKASSLTYSISAFSYKNINPVVPNTATTYLANSAFFEFASRSTSSLRSRLTSVTPLTSTRNIFTTYNRTTNTFIRNPNLWCADLTDQLTSLVVQKLGAAVYSYGGILITPRHLLYVQHAFPRTERVRFVRSDNTVISAAPLASSDSTTYKNDFPIASLSSVDTNYQDIGIVLLDRDVSLSGINVMPIAAITPTERTIMRLQYIPTLLCSQAPGRTTGSTNPNPLSARDFQMTISSTNFLNMTTAWGSNSANPFYSWDVRGAGYRLWDGDSGNSHLLFNNNKLYIYSTTKFATGDGAVVSALSGAINYLIDKADQLAGITTNMKPTYYTIDQIANR